MTNPSISGQSPNEFHENHKVRYSYFN